MNVLFIDIDTHAAGSYGVLRLRQKYNSEYRCHCQGRRPFWTIITAVSALSASRAALVSGTFGI